jgi:peptidoglycan-N-acetylglucosamine deacetylase
MLRNVLIVLLGQIPLAILPALPAGIARWAAVAAWALLNGWFIRELLGPRGTLFGATFWTAAPQPRVALTFDDGPHPEDTPAILEILRAAGARATFFFVGESARRHPDLVRRVAAAGHEVGAHSDTHPWWFSLAPPWRVAREVSASAETLASLAGRAPIHFRPPVGHKSLFLVEPLRARGMRLVTWSSRSYDTLGRSPESILRATLATVAPGGIVLLHEGVRRPAGGPSPTVAVLPRLLEALRARGLEPVSLEDLRAGPAAPSRPDPAPGAAASGARAGSPPPGAANSPG